MRMNVRFLEDPSEVLRVAGDFLLSEPVLHNLMVTLLEMRVKYPEPGRYWIAEDGAGVGGVVFQSPLSLPANLSCMEAGALAALVDAILEQGISLPGINGEAGIAARFAGQWTERSKTGAAPTDGQRLYELGELRETSPVKGRLRKACATDRNLLVEWLRDFDRIAQYPANDAERRVDGRLAAGQLWIWEFEEPVSMAAGVGPAGGVVRVAAVYTPPEKRQNGYASACVQALSRFLKDGSYRCILYTDLANPTSNSIYRRMGYRAVAEMIRYRFGE